MSDSLKHHRPDDHSPNAGNGSLPANHWASKFGISERRLKEVFVEFGPAASADEEKPGQPL